MAFRIDNPILPDVASYCALNSQGKKIELLDTQGEETINSIIKALEPHVRDSNVEEFFTTEILNDIGPLKAPITMKIPRNQETVRQIEKQIASKNDAQKFSQFLDTILKQANFKETEWIEFKTIFLKNYEYLGILFSSLANSACLKNVKHAYLIYGVNESKKEISGINFSTDSKAWQTIEQELFRNFVPKLNFKILEFNYNENPKQHIVIFEIEAANAKPIAYCGKTFIRQDDKPIPLGDFPDLLKILSNPQQQPIIDNSIPAILQSPQFFFLINPQIANTASNNPKKTTENTDNKSKKLDIWGIIAIILTALAIPFSGFAVKSCGENEGNSSPLNVQNNHSDQLQQFIINGNNNTISNSNYSQTDNNQLKNSSIESASQNPVSDSAINELCLLYNRANAIKTDHIHTAGLLTALMDDFNTFARKYHLDEVKPCEKIDTGTDRINKCGVDRLEKIKHRLNVFKMNHKINCNF